MVQAPCDAVTESYGLFAARSVLPLSGKISTWAWSLDTAPGPGLLTFTVIVTSSPFATGLGDAVWLTTRSADALAGNARRAPARTAAIPFLAMARMYSPSAERDQRDTRGDERRARKATAAERLAAGQHQRCRGDDDARLAHGCDGGGRCELECRERERVGAEEPDACEQRRRLDRGADGRQS